MALKDRWLNAELWRNYFRQRRRRRGVPLFFAVASAVFIGAALIWLGFTVFGHVVGIDDKTRANRTDVLKTALSAVAGVGGAVALVVAYRRQQDLEEGRFVERFGAAAAQLGNPDPAVRIAGVYALAGVADERGTTFSRRQQCIDVLSGYLRLPYDPAEGESHITALVTTTKGDGSRSEEARHQTIRQNDREVRQTIVRVIVAHLQKSADVIWSLHDFDFTDALFEDSYWNEAVFSGKETSFFGARFSGHTNFDQAIFESGIISFKNAKFSGENTFVTFDGAVCSGNVMSFMGAEFSCPSVSFTDFTCTGDTSLISFELAKFDVNVAVFGGANFRAKTTSLEKAVFVTKVLSFAESQFRSSATIFKGAVFGKTPDSGTTLLDASNISFENATFDGDTVSYSGAVFNGFNTSFIGSDFRATVSFDNVRFNANQTSFNDAKFSGASTTFAWATFGNAVFEGAQFKAASTSFEVTTFSNMTSFTKVLFGGNTLNFTRAKFMKSLILFGGAIFSASETSFLETEFRGTTMFGEAAFNGAAATATFDKVIFGGDSGGHTTFRGVKFNNKATIFTRPQVWDNVDFDWDIFPDEMPACISPRTWPPALLAKGE